MTHLRAIEPASFPWFDHTRYTFSLGLAHDGHAYLSGHSASEYDDVQGRVVVRGGMAAQARTAFAKIERILSGAGLGLDDVVRVVEHVTLDGIDHYDELEAVRGEVLGDASPAVSTICVERLLRPAAWVELEVVASSGDGRARRVDSTGRRGWAPARGADDVVYLSTCLPLDEDGRLVGEGDLVAQTRQVYAVASARLEALGLSPAHITKTVDHLRVDALRQYKDTGAVRAEVLSAPYPGATGILVQRLAHPGALIQLDVAASRAELEAVNPGWERYDTLTYSPAVKAGNVLFMSGQAALDPETETAVHPGDVGAQAEYTYRNILKVLDAAGAGPQHLVRTVEYVTPDGLPGYRDVARVRQELLAEPWPASTGLVCRGLLRPEFEIEVDPMAILDPA